MTAMQQIYIIGDTHAEWGLLNNFINSNIRHSKRFQKYVTEFDEVEVIIFQCGDFGFWPHVHNTNYLSYNKKKKWNQYGINNNIGYIKDNHVKLYWCAGNHENHDEIDRLQTENDKEKFIEIMPFIYFAPFASTIKLLDGTTIMFCGGADSTDKESREAGVSWWPQECISKNDMEKAAQVDMKIDWIISHTCPSYFINKNQINEAKNADHSKTYLNLIYDKFKPAYWWFGHYHNHAKGVYEHCNWTLLDSIDNKHGKKWFESIRIHS